MSEVAEYRVSAQTRTDVWEGKWDCDRLARYYRELADLHLKRHTYLRLLLLVPMATGIASLLEKFPSLPQISAAVVAVFAIWDHLSAHEKKATIASAIAGDCSIIEVEFTDLWSMIESDSIDDSEAKNIVKQLNKRIVEITNRAGDSGLETNYSLSKKTANESRKIMEG